MSLTVRDFLARGLVAGALGGPAGEAAEFSRGTQYWGGMAAAVLYGAVIGLALGVAVAALHHRVRAHDEFGRVARVATGAFVAGLGLPRLEYPANPPAVGDPHTVEGRTRLFLSLLAGGGV